ncbi:type II secretion system protein [Acetobacterium bakii]|uniref:Prepilin-type N-terminal cleavage/methylation domain-containing protein n=1 Tax=Acetobacterium bakii TaxID=52689 RepID=A0A0L6U3M0_9FIRM|nr:type II secretion system protein [Acetobacterium bakii]KNZ43116.1 hypothetical protein AKG39_02910 [Acetobacterium bakii]
MKKIINDQNGVTLVETVVATAIIAILLVTVLGALLYGQKMVVFSDVKNNGAAQAQDLIDEIMTMISKGTLPTNENTGAYNVGTVANFIDPKLITPEKLALIDTSKIDTSKQFVIKPNTVEKVIDENRLTSDPLRIKKYTIYNVWVRVYYNNSESYVELKAYTKKDGVGV